MVATFMAILLCLARGIALAVHDWGGAAARPLQLRGRPPQVLPDRRVDAEKQMQTVLKALNCGDALGMPVSGPQTIIVVSESTGEIAKLLLSRLLVQYEEMDPPLVRVYGHVNTPECLAEKLLLASQSGSNVLVWLEKLSKESGVKAVNVMSPLLRQLSNFLDSESRNEPQGQESLDKDASNVLPLLCLGLAPALAAASIVTSRACLDNKRRGAAKAAAQGTLAGASVLPLAAPRLFARGEGCNVEQSRGRRRAPLAVSVKSQDRLEMEAQMRRLVNEEVASEDPSSMPSSDKTIYVVSDSTGETAKLMISRLLVQFSDVKPSVRLRANVRNAEQLESVVDEVSSLRAQALIFSTLADAELSKTFEAIARPLGVRPINVMQPLLSELSEFFQQEAVGAVPAIETETSPQSMSDTEFFNRVDAVQFAQQHLSGLNSEDWAQADVILIGPSRVGKVSIAAFLAQSGVNAATVDCRPDTRLPAQVFETAKNKVLVLEMQPNVLLRRRKNRVEEIRTKSAPMLFEPSYCDLARIQVETDYLNSLVKNHPQWMGPVDCTHRCLDDICGIILRTLRERNCHLRATD